MDKKKVFIKNVAMIFLIILVSTVAVIGMLFLNEYKEVDLARNVIVVCNCCLITVLTLIISLEKKSLFYDNHLHLERFLGFYFLGFVIVFFENIFKIDVLPLMFLAVAFVMVSNSIVGMLAYITILGFMLFVGGGDFPLFYMNLISGLCAIAFFQNLDYEFRFMSGLIASLVISFVIENVFYTLYLETSVSLDTFVLPMIHCVLSLFVLLLLLKWYSKRIIHKHRDKYQEINDPEYELLSNLKKTNSSVYYQAIHTAYLADKIARKIDGDSYLSKGIAYYHKVMTITETKTLDDGLKELEYREFPPKLIEAIREYDNSKKIIKQKEVAIVYFADAVITSIQFLLEKDRKAELDYEHIIELVIKKKSDHSLDSCNITFEEFHVMKEVFLQEKLYYDFLR